MRKIKNQLIINLFVLIAPLIVALLSYNFYGLFQINNHMASAGKNILETYGTILEQELQSVQDYMLNKLSNDSKILSLNYTGSYLDAYLIGEELCSDFKQFMQSGLESIYAMAVYSEHQELFRVCYHSYDASIPYRDNMKLNAELQKLMREDFSSEWKRFRTDSREFLIRVLRNDGISFAVVADLENAKSPQSQDLVEMNGYLIYADTNGRPVTEKKFVRENDIRIQLKNKDFYFTGKKSNRYMAVKQEILQGELLQIYLQPYTMTVYVIDFVQLFLFFLTIMAAVLLPVGYVFMRKNYISPIENLVSTMIEIRDGNTEKYLQKEYRIAEFNDMKETFNAMLSSIQRLKVNAYEQKLQAQSAKLQYLQIQIRPHFYLNCLKNLYALSVSKENLKLQKMILVLSDYMRSIITDNESLIRIEDEIKSIKSYLELQKMSLSNPPDYRIDIDPMIISYKIPPMSILTFVENSIKHGTRKEKSLMISVRVSLLECDERKYICITILDNGLGYTQDVLLALNRKDHRLEKKHMGIENVKQRIQLIYSSDATIYFANSDGACVEMILPVKGDEDDCFNCR